jgi:hypothetical protein
MDSSSSNMDNNNNLASSNNMDNSNKAAIRDLLRLHHLDMDSSSKRLIAPHHTVQLLTALRPINRVLDPLLKDLAVMFVSHARDLWLRYALIEYWPDLFFREHPSPTPEARLRLNSSSSNTPLNKADSNLVARLARVNSPEARRHHRPVPRMSVNTFVS